MNMKKTILSTALVASLVLLVGCGYDYDEIGRQCEKAINDSLKYEGRNVKSSSELGGGIVNVTYGYASSTYRETTVLCGIKENTIHWNSDIVSLKAILDL